MWRDLWRYMWRYVGDTSEDTWGDTCETREDTCEDTCETREDTCEDKLCGKHVKTHMQTWQYKWRLEVLNPNTKIFPPCVWNKSSLSISRVKRESELLRCRFLYNYRRSVTCVRLLFESEFWSRVAIHENQGRSSRDFRKISVRG